MSLFQRLEPVIIILTPLYLLYLSISFLPATLVHVISTAPKDISSWAKIKDLWFARFWNWFGPLSAERAAPVVKPLLYSHAAGKVLDIGSGQGHFLRLYPQDRITKIYAVEPNKDHHTQLMANAKAAGLLENDQFEIVDAKIETLSTYGIGRGSIDTICTLQSLCSVPNTQVLIPELRTYLKKGGGKWIVYEHVRRPERNGFIALWQRTLNLIWGECFNGCDLTRRTKAWIEGTGGWQDKSINSESSLHPWEEDSQYSVLPTICGVLVTE